MVEERVTKQVWNENDLLTVRALCRHADDILVTGSCSTYLSADTGLHTGGQGPANMNNAAQPMGWFCEMRRTDSYQHTGIARAVCIDAAEYQQP